MQLRFLLIPAVLGALIVGALPAPAAAQGDSPLHRVTEDIRLIRGQIELALRYERQAIQLLTEQGRAPEAVKDAIDKSTKAYVLLRYALAGLELKLERGEKFHRFKDPLLDMTRVKTTDAWNSIRWVIESGSLEIQLQRGTWAISLLEEVLLMI